MLTKLSDVACVKTPNYHIVEEITGDVEFHYNNVTFVSSNWISVHHKCISKNSHVIGIKEYNRPQGYYENQARYLVNGILDKIQIEYQISIDEDIINRYSEISMICLIIKYTIEELLKDKSIIEIGEFISLRDFYHCILTNIIPNTVKYDIELLLQKHGFYYIYLPLNDLNNQNEIKTYIILDLGPNTYIRMIIKRYEQFETSKIFITDDFFPKTMNELYSDLYIDNKTLMLTNELNKRDIIHNDCAFIKICKDIFRTDEIIDIQQIAHRLKDQTFEYYPGCIVKKHVSRKSFIATQDKLKCEELYKIPVFKIISLLNHFIMNNGFSTYLLSKI